MTHFSSQILQANVTHVTFRHLSQNSQYHILLQEYVKGTKGKFQEPQFWIGTHIRKFEIILMKGIFFPMVDLHTWYEYMCYGVLSFTYKRVHVLIIDIHTYV